MLHFVNRQDTQVVMFSCNLFDVTFVTFLDTELKRRNWNRSELARRAVISHSALSHIYNERRKPGLDICEAIAKAFNIPAEKVLRAAGLLPLKPAADEIIEQAEHIINGYKSPETKARALAYLEFLRVEEEKAVYRAKPARRPASPEPG
jgi:transcriptional regulator with XRE-family HTH domain